MPFIRRCSGVLVLLLLMAFHGRARADGDESPEMRARTLFAAAHYQEALDIYARLYAETLHPTYLRNIGRCYQGLKEPDKAISSFQEYLRKARELSAEQRAEIERFIDEMEQLKRSRATTATPPPPPPAAPPSATSSPALLDSPAVVTKSAPDAESAPVYKRWWFWAAVAAVAAAGVTTVVLLSGDSNASNGSLGALDLSDKNP